MSLLARSSTSIFLLGALVAALGAFAQNPELCFAPDTLPDAVERAYRQARLASDRQSLSDPQPFQLSTRWSATATDGGGLGQGEPTTLTWGIVPDGTPISGGVGEPANPSNLRAFLNGIYGAGNWLPVFQQVFDRWEELTGIRYVYEPNDDGVTLAGQSGILGVRPDLRIGGHRIDGNSGILAYNWFPNNGDMVIDTDDGFFNNTSNNSIRMRNVLAHEHGHGMGLSHTCPVNQTKLMEPFVSTAFDGPQHDDVLGANRGYGDIAEDDDSLGTAFDLGEVGTNGLATELSVDDNSDIDFLEFTLSSGDAIDVTVSPVGLQYLEGPQNNNGSCSAGSPFDSAVIHDLSFQVLDSGGGVIATADQTDAGEPESVTGVVVPGAAGYIEVSGDFTNDAQLYRLEINGDGLIFEDGFESGSAAFWLLVN